MVLAAPNAISSIVVSNRCSSAISSSTCSSELRPSASRLVSSDRSSCPRLTCITTSSSASPVTPLEVAGTPPRSTHSFTSRRCSLRVPGVRGSDSSGHTETLRIR